VFPACGLYRLQHFCEAFVAIKNYDGDFGISPLTVAKPLIDGLK
jgi:hypothetical protein